MSVLAIPEAAYTAAANAYDSADPDSRWLEAVDAAAPIIVATELRRLANIESRDDYLRDDLRQRADELYLPEATP